MPERHMTAHIGGGTNQIVPYATHSTQNILNYYYNFASDQPQPPRPSTVVVLGAGVDATLGLPTSASFIPRLAEFLQTERGAMVDAALRKMLKGIRFHFETFVEQAIERFAHDFDREIDTICSLIDTELHANATLSEEDRKMGRLIYALFSKIGGLRRMATLDEETIALIEEVLGMEVADDQSVDFRKTVYTESFKTVLVTLLKRSIDHSDNAILRHVYRNILDIETLMLQHFVGFYAGRDASVKTYLYISWMMWALLVDEEQRVRARVGEDEALLNIYNMVRAMPDTQVVSFNYTTFAREASPTALCFHGGVDYYVDVENKGEVSPGDIATISLQHFFQDRLPREMSFAADHKALPVPSFLPPLKLPTCFSHRQLTTWFQTGCAVAAAKKIIVLGCSFAMPDHFFADMLRHNRTARVYIYDRDIEGIAPRVCRLFQLAPERYTSGEQRGHQTRQYGRVTLVRANLEELRL